MSRYRCPVSTPAFRYAQQLVRANQRREQYYTISLPGVLETLHGINLARGEAWQQVPGNEWLVPGTW